MSRFLATRLSAYIILKMTSIEEENLTENHTHKSPNNEKKNRKITIPTSRYLPIDFHEIYREYWKFT